MTVQPQTIALVGVGDLGKFVCEELLKDPRYDVVIISRHTHKWAEQHDIPSYACPDYSEDLVLQALNAMRAVALISFVNAMEEYSNIHHSLASACSRSDTCKRFIPSEWSGNLDEFPLLPRAFGSTRCGFSQQLVQMKGVETTRVCLGWLMDYLVEPTKTYMTPIGDWHTIDLVKGEVCVRGTGNEQQSLTSARDVGRAIASLLAAPRWEPITYISSEWMTYSELVCQVEDFYSKRFTRKEPISETAIRIAIEEQAQNPDPGDWIKISLDEWMISGAAACPKEKTLQHRVKYFPDLSFTTVKEFLRQTGETGFA